MQVNLDLILLSRKVERIMLENSSKKISEDKLKCITKKFANKSLPELHEFVVQMSQKN